MSADIIVANPAEQADQRLEKIKVGSRVYQVGSPKRSDIVTHTHMRRGRYGKRGGEGEEGDENTTAVVSPKGQGGIPGILGPKGQSSYDYNVVAVGAIQALMVRYRKKTGNPTDSDYYWERFNHTFLSDFTNTGYPLGAPLIESQGFMDPSCYSHIGILDYGTGRSTSRGAVPTGNSSIYGYILMDLYFERVFDGSVVAFLQDSNTLNELSSDWSTTAASYTMPHQVSISSRKVKIRVPCVAFEAGLSTSHYVDFFTSRFYIQVYRFYKP